MRKVLTNICFVFLCVLFLTVHCGCGKKEDVPKTTAPADNQVQQTVQTPTPLESQTPVIAPEVKDTSIAPTKDIVVSVDGAVLKKSELDKKVKETLSFFKGKIPEDKKKEFQGGLRKRIVDEFVIRTVLTNELNNKKIVATDKEIQDQIKKIKANLPADKSVEAFMKENKISRDDLAFGIKLQKLVTMDLGKKVKPSEKEISKFYEENKDKFAKSESVHVRHILVTIDAKDDEKTKTEKKTKIEGLRKQILDGKDFAEIAKTNSDCPSKENGGDLGDIKKGQTVKPFEDAAFSQEINAVGPVVTTEYGHHIIQVLGKNPAKVTKIEEAKDKIAMHLEQQKVGDAFNKLTERLRKKAVIMYYEN